MSRYVAFLRAINVGGRVVKMDRLRELFEKMGFDNVETFIASGNVLFDSDSADVTAIEERIESGLRDGLGYSVGAYVRTPAELKEVTEFDELPADEETKVWVFFLKQPFKQETTAKVIALTNDSNRLAVLGREVYWLFSGPYSDSPLGPVLGKLIGGDSTSRNITTVRKIAAKLAI